MLTAYIIGFIVFSGFAMSQLPNIGGDNDIYAFIAGLVFGLIWPISLIAVIFGTLTDYEE